MQNVLQTGKRAVSAAVAAATMLFTVGAGLLQPAVAAAASAGDLIKGTSLSTVYYYGYDGMRYTFPNEKTYMTWYEDFDSVTTISDSALADLSLAGNVVYRPGSYWVKVQSDDKVYAVSTDGSIHWIESEDVATDYAGSSWASRVQDVPDVFFTDYTVGSSLMEATAFDGMLYMDGGSYYLSWNGEARMVSSAGRSANGLQSEFFLSGDGIDASSLSAGSDITDEVLAVMDAAQTETSEGTATGDVSVSLASSSVAASTVPDAASGVEVATFKFTAGDAATVDVINVSLMGLAATSDIASSGAYLYEGSERLTDGKSFNSSTRQAIFGSLNLDFAAGETRYFTVVLDMANAGTTTTFSVGIEDDSDVESSGDVTGSFPVEGNTMSIVNSSVGSVTIIDTGSLSNPVLGENDATISKFKLTAGSTEDVSFERITLKVNDAPDHSDYQLWQDGTWLADGEYIGDKLVLFDLGSNAFAIEKGADRTFDVTADIGGNSADTITTHLDNGADLYVVGSDFGYGVTVTDDDFDTAAEGSSVTIQGGELTVSFSGPSAVDVSSSAENFSLFEGTLAAERTMTITAMPFNLAMSEADSANDSTFEHDPISDIRIVNADTGALLSGPLDLAATADGDVAEVLSFTDDFTVDAGETLNFKVTADVETTADNNDTFTITMDMTSGLTAEDDDGDSITDIVPGADLAGNAQRIVTSGLTVTLSSTPTGTKTYVRGTDDVLAASFNLAAASGGDIEVTDFSPTVKVDEDGGGTYATGTEGSTDSTARITSCSIYDGTTLVAGPESISTAASGKINFTDFSYWVDAGTTQTLDVYCDLANVNPGTADLFAWTMIASTDMTALDEDGDSATVTGTNINFGSSTPTMIISVTNVGSLAITAASDTPNADFLLTGSSNSTVSKFRFDATSEAFVIDRLTVTEEEAETDNGTTDSNGYSNNVSLVTISYPDSTGTTVTETGALTGNEITFNGLDFYVGKDDHEEVTVKVNISSTDRSGGSATSNEQVRMGLSRDTTNDDQIRAVGDGSGQTLDDDDIAVATATSSMKVFVIRETAPTITLSSSSPDGTGFTPGNQESFRFNVAAAAGEDVVLNNLIFTFSAADNAATDWNQCDTDVTDGSLMLASGADFKFYNLTEDSSASSALAGTYSLLKSTGAVCDTTDVDVAFVKLALTTAEVIPAGSTYVYSLWVNSDSASSVNNDSLQIGLAGDPITTTYINVSNALDDADIAITATTVNVDSGASFAVGDIVGMDVDDSGVTDSDEEKVLVTAISSNALTVIRGYLASTVEAADADADSDDYEVTDDLQRLPTALLWQDDGSTSVSSSTQEYYGAYLVDSLPVVGNAMSF